MRSNREHHATLAACVAATALAVMTALAACSGGSPEPAAAPTDAPIVTTPTPERPTTRPPADAQAPAVTPTRASTGLETPRPRSAPKGAVLLTAAATGSAIGVADGHPDVGCVYFQWHPSGPTTPPGVAFVIDHVKVSPRVWRPVDVSCSFPACARGAVLDGSGCEVALTRAPKVTGSAAATAALVGSVRCRAPATRAQCATFEDAIRAFTTENGAVVQLDADQLGVSAGGSGDGTGDTPGVDSGTSAGTGPSTGGGDDAGDSAGDGAGDGATPRDGATPAGG